MVGDDVVFKTNTKHATAIASYKGLEYQVSNNSFYLVVASCHGNAVSFQTVAFHLLVAIVQRRAYHDATLCFHSLVSMSTVEARLRIVFIGSQCQDECSLVCSRIVVALVTSTAGSWECGADAIAVLCAATTCFRSTLFIHLSSIVFEKSL
jgi:hypothetical protein